MALLHQRRPDSGGSTEHLTLLWQSQLSAHRGTTRVRYIGFQKFYGLQDLERIKTSEMITCF